MPLPGSHPATERWFQSRFREPTEPQRRAWPLIQAGRNALIAAPTGSGKTFAAFLAAIDSLLRQGLDGTLGDGTQGVYVSPLKALSNHVPKNLAKPLAGTHPTSRMPLPEIIDSGHARALDLAIEIPSSPLEAVMAAEVWDEIYERLVQLISEHRTTLVFVNTRRLAERLTLHLSERLGADQVTSHHGSLSKEKRLDAETRLKEGKLKALVATASLELGIDIGAVDLVCQIGSTRSIATLLQRVGRSGHHLAAVPKGRLFPLSRDELIECAALVRAAHERQLDRLIIPAHPLDILAQQIVATVACEEWQEDALFEMVRGAYPYRDVSRKDFDAVVQMLAEGFTTRRGRRGAYVHYDGVDRPLRPRRGARPAPPPAGGADSGIRGYPGILEPAETLVRTPK